MRVLFAGSPAVAVPSLTMLSEMEMKGNGIVLAGILTNPDSRRGRHGRAEPTDISVAASELDAIRKERGFPFISQLKPEKLDEHARDETAALFPDLLVSFGCGHFFGPLFLALFPLGGINIHPSLLPKYRGASPVPAAILAMEKETGISIQRIAPELDTGDIFTSDVFQLSGRETTLSLCETVSRRAALLLSGLLLNFDPGAARPQEGEAVYCREIKKEAGLIDWTRSAAEIDAQIRAYTPWPLSFTCFGGNLLFILETLPLDALPGVQPGTPDALPGVQPGAPDAPPGAAPGTVLGTDKDHGILIQTGKGILAVSKLQWQAKKALDWKGFCNGSRNFMGARLG